MPHLPAQISFLLACDRLKQVERTTFLYSGCTARSPDITRERVLSLKEPRLREFPALWALAQQVVEQAVEAGRIPVKPAEVAGMTLAP